MEDDEGDKMKRNVFQTKCLRRIFRFTGHT